MIKLNELLMFVDAKELRIHAPITHRLKARIIVNANNPAEIEDLVEIYGSYDVLSVEPCGVDGALKIELGPDDRKMRKGA